MLNEIVTFQPGMTLAELEKKAILSAFRYYRSNKTLTAQALGIAIRTLDNKLELYESAEEKARTKQPTRNEVLEMEQLNVTKTVAGGHDPRRGGIADPHITGDRSGKTGPLGQMSREQIDEIRNRKAAYLEAKAKRKQTPQPISETKIEAEAGLSVEPDFGDTEKLDVPLSESKEVQSVLSPAASANRGRQNGGSLQNRSTVGSSNQVYNNKSKSSGGK